MPIQITISTEIICALVTFAGVVFANYSSRRIAKQTAEKEMEKLERTWKHDNEAAFEQAFREMAEATTRYILDSSYTNQEIARTKTMLMLTYTSGDLANTVKRLHTALKCRPSLDAEELLHEVIECRRQLRIKQGTTKRKKFFS